MKLLERVFKLKESNTTPQREVLGGITTFMTMAYILVVNPAILSAAGMDSGAVFTATAVASALACFMMGLLANLPVALAPGLGISAFFSYTVVLQMGYSWEMALAAVFVEGIIFIVLSLLNVRELIIRSIPMVLKKAIGIGIGLFVALIGLSNAGVIVKGAALTSMGDVTQPQVILTFMTLIFIGVMLAKGVKGALLLGMVVSTIIGLFMGIVTIPEGFSVVSAPSSLEPIFMKMDFSKLLSLDMAIIIFTFVFADLFDTAGTLFAVCSKSNLVDKDGNIKNAKSAFLTDAVATTAGAALGTVTVTSFIESLSGVAEGGRTGLTAVTTGALFVVALLFAPIFGLIPVAATSAVLIVVGLFMATSLASIDFSDYKDSLPVFITVLMIPLGFSISEGIVYGFLSYVIIRLLLGRFKDVSVMMYLLAILFIFKILIV